MIVPSEKAWAKELDKICRITEYEAKLEHCELFRLFRIMDMMKWANVTEAELEAREIIHTEFGEDLSWEYLSCVRSHSIQWNVPTQILYGEKDQLTSLATMKDFAEKYHAGLTVMENGEHWFHTEEQMTFLDDWIRRTK